MMRAQFLTAALIIVALGATVAAQSEVQVLPVRDNLFMLQVGGTNVTVQTGKQGVLLVDASTAVVSDQVLAAIAKITRGNIRYLVNTSADPAHTGGNENLRKAGMQIFGGPGSGALSDGTQGAVIFAHENVMNRMSAPTGKQSPTPAGAWPTDTYFGNQKEHYFNGEPIELIHIASAHTDGDTMVYFRRSDVVSAGEIFTTTNYPVIDLQRGGNVQGVIEGLNRLLDILVPEHEEEGGTLVIPGRGRICDEADVVEYRDMVTIIRDRVQDMLKRDMTLDQIKAAKPTRDYDPQYEADAAWTPDMFVEAVYRSLLPRKP